jgi:hypothetical protein
VAFPAGTVSVTNRWRERLTCRTNAMMPDRIRSRAHAEFARGPSLARAALFERGGEEPVREILDDVRRRLDATVAIIVAGFGGPHHARVHHPRDLRPFALAARRGGAEASWAVCEQATRTHVARRGMWGARPRRAAYGQLTDEGALSG